LGAPVMPGAPHNPHFNGPPRPPCEDERCATVALLVVAGMWCDGMRSALPASK
jgi:hypothetical protein